MQDRILDIATRFPKLVFLSVLALVLAAGSQLPRIIVDTDPENMLPADQVDRVFHDHAKEEFALYEMIVVGVVNDTHENGVFNVASLTRVHELTRAIEQIEGVIREDILSLASVDDISQEGPGTIRFEWLMNQPPASQEEAMAVRAAAQRLPMLNGSVISEDGQAAAIYVPIVSKDETYRISKEIAAVVASFEGEEQYHVTGLPVAEDTFGVEMFIQMAISAPLAGLVIFLLMWFFFRSPTLIIAPMLVAMATVIITMGLLIGMGFSVHIMISMIPIFLMPIAVVDSVHILSEFADAYPATRNARTTIAKVMKHLFTPMLFTSLTSAAGFVSLAFTPIPPVRVFGAFVAFGIMLAFVLTLIFIPAYAVALNPKRLKALGGGAGDNETGRLARSVRSIGRVSQTRAKLVLALAVAVLGISAYGISTIQINDNPVRWFKSGHPIRVADHVLNEHFGGTYMAYIVLSHEDENTPMQQLRERAEAILGAAGGDGAALAATWQGLIDDPAPRALAERLDSLIDGLDARYDTATEAEEPVLDDLLLAVEETQTQLKYFATPEALHNIEALEEDLLESDLVGKSNSLAQIVKTVYRELREGDETYYTIPDSAAGVSQTLLSYQSSHRPGDLWHMVTPDYRKANIWLQLKSGDNQDMETVTDHVSAYLAENPLPEGVSLRWAGLTYINVVWQEAMVRGMLESLLGSFVIVFLMMVLLFRSVAFGAMAMIPLTITISFIYGLIGLIGKDYDMPVAVLSALTLGLSVDFAIHFLQRARAVQEETGSWSITASRMFEEPGRAIARNAIVIAVGFLPLLAAPLVPYNTVGIFMALIMAISSIVTMIVLPSILHVARTLLFKESSAT